jgi:hypothetical protein
MDINIAEDDVIMSTDKGRLLYIDHCDSDEPEDEMDAYTLVKMYALEQLLYVRNHDIRKGWPINKRKRLTFRNLYASLRSQYIRGKNGVIAMDKIYNEFPSILDDMLKKRLIHIYSERQSEEEYLTEPCTKNK